LAGGLIVQWALETRPALPGFPDAKPWQFVFLVVGLPGLLVALLIWLTVREPVRQLTAQETDQAPRMAEVLRFVSVNRRALIPVFLGFGCFAVNGYAFQVWGPAFFMRLHDLTPGEVGLIFGVGYGVGGTIAIISGGLISDAIARRGRIDAPVLVSIGAALMQAPCFLAAYLVSSTPLAIVLFVGGIFSASIVGGLQAATVQSLAPNRMRGMLAALFGATVNVAGLGIAPTLTAALSDGVFGGPLGIGKALAVTTVIAMTSCVALLLAGRPAARMLATSLAGEVCADQSRTSDN
jgi:MFS family permease